MKLVLEHIVKHFSFRLILYCILFTVAIFTNKYILSTLKFTYPTVFQGWQTLIASLFLFIMRSCSKENVKFTIHGYDIISLFPNLIFHVISIVAGSKALSGIPISIFLSVSNISNVAIYFSSSTTLPRIRIISGVITLVTSIVLLLSRNGNVADISNIWLITYIFFTVVDVLYLEFVNIKISRLKKLWYTNCFSVLILAPASLYLQEAFSALEFALSNKLKFYVSVLISGVCGGVTQVLSTNIDYSFSQTNAVTLAALTSQFVHRDDSLDSTLFHILVINLISNTILCLSDKLTERTLTDSTVV